MVTSLLFCGATHYDVYAPCHVSSVCARALIAPIVSAHVKCNYHEETDDLPAMSTPPLPPFHIFNQSLNAMSTHASPSPLYVLHHFASFYATCYSRVNTPSPYIYCHLYWTHILLCRVLCSALPCNILYCTGFSCAVFWCIVIQRYVLYQYVPVQAVPITRCVYYTTTLPHALPSNE